MRVRAPNNTPAALRKALVHALYSYLVRGSQRTALLSVSQQWKPCQQKSEAVNVKVELFVWLISALFVAVKNLCLILLSTLTHFWFDSSKKVDLNWNDPGWPLTLTKTLWIRTVLLSDPLLWLLFVASSSSVSPWGQQTESERSERRGCVTRTALEQIEAQPPSLFTAILAFNNISSKPTLQTLAGDRLTDFCLFLAHYALLVQFFGFNEHEIAKAVMLLKGTKGAMARIMHSCYVVQSDLEFFFLTPGPFTPANAYTFHLFFQTQGFSHYCQHRCFSTPLIYECVASLSFWSPG